MYTATEIISLFSADWNDASSAEGAEILKLSLLRSVILKLHAEKSTLLARGLRNEAAELKEWETKIVKLREKSDLESDLLQLILDNHTFPKKKRNLPEDFFQTFDRDKFTRYDREWEKAIAAAAVAQDWNFWKLEAWVKIERLEDWERHLAKSIWPHGVLLYTEAAPATSLLENESPTSPPIWKGCWILTLQPRIQQPSQILLHLSQWEELPEKPPEPLLLKALYP